MNQSPSKKRSRIQFEDGVSPVQAVEQQNEIKDMKKSIQGPQKGLLNFFKVDRILTSTSKNAPAQQKIVIKKKSINTDGKTDIKQDINNNMKPLYQIKTRNQTNSMPKIKINYNEQSDQEEEDNEQQEEQKNDDNDDIKQENQYQKMQEKVIGKKCHFDEKIFQQINKGPIVSQEEDEERLF